MIVIKETQNEPGEFTFDCPGCECSHFIRTAAYRPGEESPRWTFNGNTEKPTISPSIKVTGGNEKGETICHFYVRDGRIEYLNDCTHELRGKPVEMQSME